MSKRAKGSHFVEGICGASIKATNFALHAEHCSQCRGIGPIKRKLMFPFWKKKPRIETDIETDNGTVINIDFKNKEML